MRRGERGISNRFSPFRRGGGIIAGALEGNEKLPARPGCRGGGCPAFALRRGCGWGGRGKCRRQNEECRRGCGRGGSDGEKASPITGGSCCAGRAAGRPGPSRSPFSR